MSLIVSCAECGKKYKVGDDKAGKRIKCPGCGAIISIPLPESSPNDEGEVDLWDLPPAEDTRALPPRELPPRRVSRKSEPPPSEPPRRSRRMPGTPGWLKFLLIMIFSLGGLAIVACCGLPMIAPLIRSLRSSGPYDPAKVPWTVYTAKDAGFSIEFPNTDMSVVPDGNVTKHQAKIVGKEAVFGVGISTHREGVQTYEANLASLRRTRDKVVTGRNLNFINSSELKIGEYPAVRYEYKIVSSGLPLIVTALDFQTPQRYYQVMVVRDEGDNLSKEIDRFCNSFRFALRSLVVERLAH